MNGSRVEGYLSRLAQDQWPAALVIIQPADNDTGEEWILRGADLRGERLDGDIGLGDRFSGAKDALKALIAAEKAGKTS